VGISPYWAVGRKVLCQIIHNAADFVGVPVAPRATTLETSVCHPSPVRRLDAKVFDSMAAKICQHVMKYASLFWRRKACSSLSLSSSADSYRRSPNFALMYSSDGSASPWVVLFEEIDAPAA
jgi:hypothetical protein